MGTTRAPWCNNSREWLDFKTRPWDSCPYPKRFYNHGCVECGYYEEKEQTKYYIRKINKMKPALPAGRAALEEVEE